jgi:drug/metabolite transporter (DMT)-like permease
MSAILPLGLASAFLETGQMSSAWVGGWELVGCVAFSGLIVSVVAHTAYYALIGRYEANLIAPLLLMSPIFTIILGVTLLGERLDTHMIVGAVIALAGVLIIALRPNRAAPRAILIRERV